MNGIDRTLASLLEGVAGDPPRDIDTEAVLARARRQRMTLAAAATGGGLALGGLALGAVVLTQGPRSVPDQLGQTPTPSAAPSASAAPTATSTACSPAHAAASLLSSQGAAGTMRWAIRIRNTGTSACTSYGYPGVAIHRSTGWVRLRVTHGGYPDINVTPRRLTVPAGGYQYAVAYWSDVTTQAGNCVTFDAVRLSLPGQAGAVPLSASGCLTLTSMRVGPLTTIRPMP